MTDASYYWCQRCYTRKHRQRTQGYIQALEEEVLRLRGVELSLKDNVKTLQEQLQAHSQALPMQESLLASPGPFTPSITHGAALSGLSTPEMITVNWKELYEISPESACCINAAEATPPAVPWAMDTSELAQPFNLWIDSLPGFGLPDTVTQAPGSTDITSGISEMTVQGPLSSRVGLKCILLYGPPSYSKAMHCLLMMITD